MFKVAILGYGFMGKTHANAYSSLPNTKIVAIGDGRVRGAPNAFPDRVELYDDLDRLVAETDADIIDLCLPTPLHKRYAIEAANRGKHILCEKPIALSTSDVDEILAAVKKAGVTFMVAQVLRFFAHYSAAREVVLSGALGEIIFVTAQRLSEPPRWGEWFRDPEQSGGALFDLHIHDLDYLLWLFGAPDSLFATGVRSAGGCWDHVCNTLQYPNKRVTVEASYMMPSGWPFTTGLKILGTKGCLEYGFRVNGNVDALTRAEHSLAVYLSGGAVERIELEDPNPYKRQIEYFVECVEKGITPERVLPEDSRRVIAVLEYTKRSLETSMPVVLSGQPLAAGKEQAGASRR